MIGRALSLLLLVGCAGSAGQTSTDAAGTSGVDATSPPASDPSEPEVATPPDEPASGPDLSGAWRGEACGDRTYPRELVFTKDQRFESNDLVSPCPPGVACVWSGIVTRSGAWSVEQTTILLKADLPKDAPSGPASAVAPLPEQLTRAHDILKDTEGCAYRRGPGGG